MLVMVIRMTPVAAVCASHLANVIRETSLFEGVVKDIVVPTAPVLLSFDTGRRTLGTNGLQKEHKSKERKGSLYCDLLIFLNRHAIFWVPFESSCPEDS